MEQKHDEGRLTLRVVQLGRCRDPLNTTCSCCVTDVELPPRRYRERSPYHQRRLTQAEPVF